MTDPMHMEDFYNGDEAMDEVGCVGDHHGIACEHPTCTDCGELLADRADDCPECGRREAG